jgi:hypothetical protein
MVAPRSTPDHASATTPANSRPATQTTARFHEEPVTFTRYSHPIDRSQARATPYGLVEMYDYHECFKEVWTLSEAEQKEFAIKQAALRITAGLEPRSLRVLARQIGCAPSAIDNCVLRICERTNMRKFHVSDTTRQRQSEARKKQLQSASA